MDEEGYFLRYLLQKKEFKDIPGLISFSLIDIKIEQDNPWQYKVAVLPFESRSKMACSNNECSFPRKDHSGVGHVLVE